MSSVSGLFAHLHLDLVWTAVLVPLWQWLRWLTRRYVLHLLWIAVLELLKGEEPRHPPPILTLYPLLSLRPPVPLCRISPVFLLCPLRLFPFPFLLMSLYTPNRSVPCTATKTGMICSPSYKLWKSPYPNISSSPQ